MNEFKGNDLSPALLKRITESICDGIIVIDREFTIQYVNSHFAAVYDGQPEDFIGRKCTEVVGFDHCHESCPHREIMEKGSDYSGHNLYCRKNAAGPYCVSISPMTDSAGKVIGLVELYRNMKQLGMYIGTLEDTNAALRLEKERLHRMLDDISDGYFCATPGGVITSVNGKLQALLSKEAPNLVGRPCSEAICGQSCQPDCPLQWAVEHQQNVIDSHQLLDIEGEQIACDKSVLLVEDQQGKIESVICVFSKVAETLALKERAEGASSYSSMVTKNKGMQEVFDIIREVAPTDAPVLVTGETGTGKELVATALQRLSQRADQPFVRINCSALTESLLESELFGHARGAFTGAVANYAGKFKKADKGTVFLDEIEEMSPGLQAKLLRVLESNEFEPVGSNRLEKVDVRIIAATNDDMAQMIESGRFRADLYYRLNVIRIDVPPLRDRPEDIPVLIQHRLDFLKQRYKKDLGSVSTRALGILSSYEWPGNVRQLFGALEYAFLKAKSSRIERKDLPVEIHPRLPGLPTRTISDETSELERIRELLALYPSNRIRVARELGISRTTLWRKMRELGIRG
jgi:PAS domain S-box-containing protein